MKLMKIALLLFAVFVTHAVPSAEAASGGSSRATKKLAVAGTMLGDPYPSLMGLNVGYNLAPWFQVHVGYGSISYNDPTSGAPVNTGIYSGGGKFFVPTWNFSPTVGLSYSMINANGSMSIAGTTIDGTGSMGLLYLTAGLEWQTRYGLMIGMSYNMGLAAPFSNLGFPGFRIGWTF